MKIAVHVSIGKSPMREFLFSRLSISIRRGCRSCSLGVHRNILVTETFFRKKIEFFHQFRTLCEKLSANCCDNFGGVVKTAFYVSRGMFFIFFGKMVSFLSFSVFERCFIGIKLKSFRRGCENCILWVHTDILKANRFFGNKKNF